MREEMDINQIIPTQARKIKNIAQTNGTGIFRQEIQLHQQEGLKMESKTTQSTDYCLLLVIFQSGLQETMIRTPTRKWSDK